MSATPSSAKLHRISRVALVVPAFVLLILSTVWLVLPRWLQGSGAQQIGAALGREVRFESVRFEPWRLALVTEGVTIAGAPSPRAQAPAPLLTIARVDAALSLRSLWHLSPVLESLTIDKPILRLTRLEAGRYDIDDLIARFANSAQPAQPDSDPPDLALYNIRLSEGQVLFDDRPAARRHELAGLRLELPFVSTLDADIKVHVQPRLAGRINGVEFGSEAALLPFAESPEATLKLKLAGLDLATYIPYVPAGLPLRLEKGRIDSDLDLRFSQPGGKAPQMQLSGMLALNDIALHRPGGQPWLGWRELKVMLKDVQPLRRQLQFGKIAWRAPTLALERDAAGRLWFPMLPAPSASSSAPVVPAATGPAAAAPAWTLAVESFELADAQLAWRDAAAGAAGSRPADLRAEGLSLKLGPARWPLKAAVPVSFGLRLPSFDGASAPAELSGQGSLAAERLALEWQWQGLTLQTLQAYLPLHLRGTVAGRGELVIAAPLEPDAARRATVGLRELKLRELRVGRDAKAEPLLNLAEAGLDRLDVDVAAARVAVGDLRLVKPQLQMTRAADGRWSHETLLAAQNAAAAPAAGAALPDPAPAWTIELGGVGVEGGAVRLRAAGEAAPLQFEQIAVKLGKLVWPARAEPTAAQLSLRMPAAGARRAAQLDWQGRFALAPLSAAGRLQIERLPLHLIDGWLDPGLGVQLQRAELALRGEFAAEQKSGGWQATGSGDLGLADLRLYQASRVDGRREIGEELLSWRALQLQGVGFAQQPGGAPRLEIGDARLDDFYARLIVNAQGRFNLQDLAAPAPAASSPVPASAPAPVASAPAPTPALRPSLQWAVRQTRLSNGRVDFTDHFIRPNYSAYLSELQGSLGAFASGKPEMAPLSLKGRVAGTGLLDVSGSLNPAGPLAMDIQASASDIELAPLSPYAAKYAGYAIERGKFMSRVRYKIDAGGALEANNQIILNQLTFGEAVDSPDATKLPVRLAVALLKDRDGVIDINLPVSGSLNDPEFSIGGLVVKLIGNLLGKALTAPFALFSGGTASEVSQLSFAPGASRPLAPDQLDKLADLLNQRPGLSLTITGWVDPIGEKAAVQALQLEAALLAEKRREQPDAAAGAVATVALTDAERTRLLKQVYDATKLPNKPRNMLGLARSLPPAEMAALLQGSYAVGEERLRELAVARGLAVRDALIAKGIANGRLFLAAPKLRDSAAAGTSGDWTPHADLSLGAH